MAVSGKGVFQVNSDWSSGNLIFFEKTVGRTTTGDVLTIATDAVTIGNLANDIDFKVFGAESGNYILYNAGIAQLGIVSMGAYTSPPFAVTRTFLTADFDQTYHAASRVTLELTNDVPNTKYASAFNVRITGAGDVASGGQLYGLWVDSAGTAAAIGGTFYMGKFSVQAGAAIPTAYWQFQTADPGVTYAFSFANNNAVPPCVAGGTGSTYTIAVQTPDGNPGYIRVFAAK